MSLRYLRSSENEREKAGPLPSLSPRLGLLIQPWPLLRLVQQDVPCKSQHGEAVDTSCLCLSLQSVCNHDRDLLRGLVHTVQIND